MQVKRWDHQVYSAGDCHENGMSQKFPKVLLQHQLTAVLAVTKLEITFPRQVLTSGYPEIFSAFTLKKLKFELNDVLSLWTITLKEYWLWTGAEVNTCFYVQIQSKSLIKKWQFLTGRKDLPQGGRISFITLIRAVMGGWTDKLITSHTTPSCKLQAVGAQALGAYEGMNKGE